MKRLIPFALIALALAAVPIALGDNGTPSTATSTTPTTQTQTPGTNASRRFDRLRLRVQRVEMRFGARCGSTSTGAPQACVTFAQKVEQRLQTLDTNLQARIAKIQQACSGSTTTTSTDKCQKAPARIAQLQQIDTSVQALIAKVQGWLGGASSSSSTNDATLGQAAAGLGQLTQQAGGNG